MYSKTWTETSTSGSCDKVSLLRQKLAEADAVLIGAGAGLSAAAGFAYSGERFRRYFGDFAAQYHFADMYAGGFYPYGSLEEYWAYWSRYIWINRYMDAPKPVYNRLCDLVKDKDYFVLTTNVDHCFQKAGFDKARLFYTQGDYGLWQCSVPCHNETYDNETTVRKMVEAQGFAFAENGDLYVPDGIKLKMKVPSELIPYCQHCHKPMSMNLRADATFVEDAGWHAAARRYEAFLRQCRGKKVLYWELGVGMNTPGIIKYNFWQRVWQDRRAFYACVNLDEAYCPPELAARSACIKGDIGAVLEQL